MSDGGKGYVQRPIVVDQEVMESNWSRIFGTRSSARSCSAKELCLAKTCQCQKGAACPGKEEASSKESF